jgi:LysM repeat protein
MRKPYGTTVRGILFGVALSVAATGVGFASTIGAKAPHPTAMQPAANIAVEHPVVPRQHLIVSSKQSIPVLEYTVQPGDTLSTIAAHEYRDSAAWPALWWVNKHAIPNPNNVSVGQHLKLSSWHPVTQWLLKDADDAAGVGVAPAVTTASVSYSSATASGPWPGGAFGACVVARESGGNPQVMNASGHYGLYQFSFDTWVAYGGSAALFGHASVAYQEQIFMNALARGGQNNWAPYDGC